MGVWALNQNHRTSAGVVAAGATGSGPALVLAHGWPWSSFSWHRIIPALSERYHVHWYDMPGYGQSEKRPDQRTSIDVQGEVFAEMMGHWGLSRPHVIAHDFGGATTLRAHLLHGCDFAQYVLMNVVAVRPWGSDFFAHVGRHVAAFQGLPPHIHRAIVEAYIRGALVSDLPTDDLAQLVSPWLDAEGASSFYQQFAQADETYTAEVEPMYRDVRCATTIIWGEADPWIPIDRARRLHELMPHAAFETIAGVGHMPQLEAAEAALAKLRDVLSL
ncbi:MAG: alpha/beta hydrolase [Pseudomonadota bacterium]